MSKIGNILTIPSEKNVSIKSENSPFGENFFFYDLMDEKALKSFIKSTERLIRSSKEYTFYIEELRTNFDILNQDNIQGNIKATDAELEFHHYPFSLYSLVESVVFKNFMEDIKINTFRVAEEVMKLHFENKVGLVSLSKTNHQLAHDGKIFINKKQIFGDYKKFMEEYQTGISTYMQDRIKEMEEASENGNPTDFNNIYS